MQLGKNAHWNTQPQINHLGSHIRHLHTTELASPDAQHSSCLTLALRKSLTGDQSIGGYKSLK